MGNIMSDEIKAFGPSDDSDVDHPELLHKIRLITSADVPILQSIKLNYDRLTEESSYVQKAYCTLVTSIILQERLYFALSRRQLALLMKADPNTSVSMGFSNKVWRKILAKLYNKYELFELVQQGGPRRASAYRLKDKRIAKYLLDKGIDGKKQKEEVLNFITKDFEVKK